MDRIATLHYNIQGKQDVEITDITYFTLVLSENGKVKLKFL